MSVVLVYIESSLRLVVVFLVAQELVLVSEPVLVYNTRVHLFDRHMIVVASIVVVERHRKLHSFAAVMPLHPS